MTWVVFIREPAETDIRKTREWYETQRRGLGEQFLASVADALKQLEKKPERFPIYYRGFRRILTKRFPYRIFYRIQGNTVIVFRILHISRDHFGKV